MDLYKGSNWKSNTFDALRTDNFTEFKFSQGDMRIQATYAITLEVSETCTESILAGNGEIEKIPGRLQWGSIEQEQLKERIEDENLDQMTASALPNGASLKG